MKVIVNVVIKQENKVLMDKAPIQINTKFEITNEKK